MASAKQKAWRKKFAAMAKSGKFRKTDRRLLFLELEWPTREKFDGTPFQNS